MGRCVVLKDFDSTDLSVWSCLFVETAHFSKNRVPVVLAVDDASCLTMFCEIIPKMSKEIMYRTFCLQKYFHVI